MTEPTARRDAQQEADAMLGIPTDRDAAVDAVMDAAKKYGTARANFVVHGGDPNKRQLAYQMIDDAEAAVRAAVEQAIGAEVIAALVKVDGMCVGTCLYDAHFESLPEELCLIHREIAERQRGAR